MTLRGWAKSVAHLVAIVMVLPSLLSFRIRAALMGRDRALEGSTQAFALIPGLAGQYLRRAFLSQTLARCDRTATIEFGTIFSAAGARLEENAYIGPRCHLGLVHIQRNVLIAAGVHIPSGRHTHRTASVDTPIRDQEGARALVTIGEGAWVGSASVVMADVGANCVVGAGAVVTRALPAGALAAGVPARVVRVRQDGQGNEQ
jgi:acetyltransferase-like isoleucine patch superfamily enzyme